jgi:uncharacterized repeat protein (TIGR01451 family)
LPDLSIYKFIVDRFNNKWICTAYGGLVTFNEQGLNFSTPVAKRHKVNGHVFFDADSNGVQNAAEPFLPYQHIHAQPIFSIGHTNAQGEYTILLPAGNYSITPQLASTWHVTTDSLAYQVTVDSVDQSGFDFGISAPPFSGYSIDLYNGIMRCGFIVPHWIYYSNIGSTLDSGYVEFVIDTACSFVSSSPPPDSVSNNAFYWFFNGLAPFSGASIHINVQTPNLPGYLVYNTASIHYHDGSQFVLSDFSHTDEPILCAYDPNDKSVSPQGVTPLHLTLLTDTLNYTIRFENLGNDTAFFVKVIDTLDQHLDPLSVQFVSASHPCQWTNHNGVLLFDFPTCNLPPSSLNPAAANGYVHFRARPYTSTASNTVVKNKAHILFNFNESIATNEVFNTLVDSILSQHSLAPPTAEKLRIRPNPFSDETLVTWPNPQNQPHRVTVMNLYGQKLLDFETPGNAVVLNGQSLGAGLFIIQVASPREKFLGKIVVQD